LTTEATIAGLIFGFGTASIFRDRRLDKAFHKSE
jgi:hypothetical protein